MPAAVIRATSKFTGESGLSIEYAMAVPRGDQSGWRSVSGLVVRRRTSLPSAFMLKMSNSLACGSVRRLENAIRPLKLSGVAAAAGVASISHTAAQHSNALMSARRGGGGLRSPSSRSTITARGKAGGSRGGGATADHGAGA